MELVRFGGGGGGFLPTDFLAGDPGALDPFSGVCKYPSLEYMSAGESYICSS